jgi:hypothetical protein
MSWHALQVVPGDVVLLSAGSLIPGDVRLIEAHNLFVRYTIKIHEKTLNRPASNQCLFKEVPRLKKLSFLHRRQ